MPANFKTYEAQARLLAAVLAAHPEIKLNYRAIAQHYGSDSTFSSIEHRFRPIKEQSKALREAVAKDFDPMQIDILDKTEIARVFGGSTPDGIQFQFRGIKKEASSLLDAANNGQASADALPKTPSKRTGTKAKATGSAKSTKSNMPSTPSTTNTSRGKRKAGSRSNKEIYSKESDDAEVDYDALDDTPIAKKIRTQPNKMTSTEFNKEVEDYESSQVANATPSLALNTTQEATPSETDNSALTSPVLKFEAEFGNPGGAAVPVAAQPRAVHQPTSIFGGGPMSSHNVQATFNSNLGYDHFNDIQPGTLAYSFGGSGGVPSQNIHQDSAYDNAPSFNYGQSSFTDGEV